MSEYATVARPYARAAFSYATEHQCLDNWLNFLSLLSQVKKSSDILSSANCFSNEYKLNFVKTVLQGYYDEKQINFIRLLMENSRLEAVDDIFELYSSMYEDYHNIAEAEVISAHKLTSENLEKLQSCDKRCHRCNHRQYQKCPRTYIALAFRYMEYLQK